MFMHTHTNEKNIGESVLTPQANLSTPQGRRSPSQTRARARTHEILNCATRAAAAARKELKY